MSTIQAFITDLNIYINSCSMDNAPWLSTVRLPRKSNKDAFEIMRVN